MSRGRLLHISGETVSLGRYTLRDPSNYRVSPVVPAACSFVPDIGMERILWRY